VPYLTLTKCRSNSCRLAFLLVMTFPTWPVTTNIDIQQAYLVKYGIFIKTRMPLLEVAPTTLQHFRQLWYHVRCCIIYILSVQIFDWDWMLLIDGLCYAFQPRGWPSHQQDQLPSPAVAELLYLVTMTNTLTFELDLESIKVTKRLICSILNVIYFKSFVCSGHRDKHTRPIALLELLKRSVNICTGGAFFC